MLWFGDKSKGTLTPYGKRQKLFRSLPSRGLRRQTGAGHPYMLEGQTPSGAGDTSKNASITQNAIKSILKGPDVWKTYREEAEEKGDYIDLSSIDFSKAFKNMPIQKFHRGSRWNDGIVIDGEELHPISYTLFNTFNEIETYRNDDEAIDYVPLRCFADYNFEGLSFDKSQIEGFAFLNCDLNNAWFVGCGISNCVFISSEKQSGNWFDGAEIKSVYFDVELSSVDFYSTPFLKNVEFERTVSGAVFSHVEFLDDVLFSGQIAATDSAEEYVRSTSFYSCQSAGGLMFPGSMSDCVIIDSSFRGASFGQFRAGRVIESDLSECDFSNANLTDSSFQLTNIRRANFSNAYFENTRFHQIIYKRRELTGHFMNVMHPEGILGDIISRQDLRDQAFIDGLSVDRDAKERELLNKKKGNEIIPAERSKLRSFIDTLGTFDRRSAQIGAAFALIYSLFLFSHDGIGLSYVAMITFVGGLLGGVMNTSFAQRHVLLRVWRLLDYGRDWDRILFAAGIAVFILGFVYVEITPEHICFRSENSEAVSGALSCSASDNEGLEFYPWYVAVMGFAALGLSDLVEIRTAFGASVVVLNVVLGFIALGLLLAVVQRSFTRRS